MNNSQKILLAVYLPITFLLIIFDNIYPDADFVRCVKYTTIITLFLSAANIKKRFYEQKIMTLALFFVVVGDFFLVFSRVILDLGIYSEIFGMTGFFIAYLCLIAVYQKNFKLGKAEILTIIPVISIFLFIFFSLKIYVKGPMLIAALVFGLELSYMTWTSICTIFRNYYKAPIARLIALSSILMFICDMGVAYHIFHPEYIIRFTSWLENIIWAAYIPGWTFLAVIINEENLLRS